MKIKAVIWDFGGVLMRTEDYAPRQYLADRVGVSPEDLEHIVFSSASGKRAQLGEIPVTQHWSTIQNRFGLDNKGLQFFQRTFFAGDVLDLSLVSYIRSLRPRYKIGMLSNNFSDLRNLLFSTWQIGDIFDDLVISAEIGMLKPDAEIFHLALARLGVSPREAVFIDDFLHNIEGAQAVKLNTVHFRNPEQARQELEFLLGT